MRWGKLKTLDRRHYVSVGVLAFFLALNTATSSSKSTSSSSPTPPPAATHTVVHHTFRGQRFHSIYGWTEDEKVIPSGNMITNADHPGWVCQTAARVSTGTNYISCVTPDAPHCLLFMPLSNFDPNGDNLGWECNDTDENGNEL